jgi:agmatine deiminase
MVRKNKSPSTPAALGFRMPAEWEPHAATWIAWPHNRSDWPGKFEAIPWVYCDIVRYLARVERVHILVNDGAAEAAARRALTRADALRDTVEFHRWPTNRVWTRDFGPIFVRRDETSPRSARSATGGTPGPTRAQRVRAGFGRRGGAMKVSSASQPPAEVGIVNWGFTAWAKYPDWELDDRIPARISHELRMREWRPEVEAGGQKHRVVLEGGSIDVNGRGSILVTEECLLSGVQQRNPELALQQSLRENLENAFRDYLGAEHVIWLGRGIVGDDTHGHVDDIARFAAPDLVVAAVESNPADANFEALQENLERLRDATDQDGRRLRVVELPMPRAIVFRGHRLPASYANFYLANQLVLVPTFNDPNDRVALGILSDVFPDREVVGIHCGDLIWGLGALHCMTQQQAE